LIAWSLRNRPGWDSSFHDDLVVDSQEFVLVTYSMKNLSCLGFLQVTTLMIAAGILAGCSNAQHFAPPPVRVIMKIRKHREKEANASPTPSPSPSASSSQSMSNNPSSVTPVPGGIIRGIIDSRLQGTQ